VLNYHGLVGAGMGMVITGILKKQSGKEGNSGALFEKIGVAIILLSWILLTIFTLISLALRQKGVDPASYTLISLGARQKSAENLAAYVDGTRVGVFRP
jgi:hypothetical protein